MAECHPSATPLNFSLPLRLLRSSASPARASLGFHQRSKVGWQRLFAGRVRENVPAGKGHNQIFLWKHLQVLSAESSAQPYVLCGIRPLRQPTLESILKLRLVGLEVGGH